MSTPPLPRRVYFNRLTPAELVIREAIVIIHSLPDEDTRLTDAVVLLRQALDKVGDYVDRIHPAQSTLNLPASPEEGR